MIAGVDGAVYPYSSLFVERLEGLMDAEEGGGEAGIRVCAEMCTLALRHLG